MKKVLGKDNNKGFTLAELLIVVAIIAVLVAIAIPIFTSRLESSREATDAANLRSAYAAATTAVLQGKDDNSVDISAGDYVYTKDASFAKSGTGMSGKAAIPDFQGTKPDLPNGITYDGYGKGKTISINVGTNSNVAVGFTGGSSTP